MGGILISVNPFKPISALYSAETLMQYRNKNLIDNPPHIFATADETFRRMLEMEGNQSVVIRYVKS
jgi:myosin-1